jgi:hypothetical protein
MVGVAHSVCGIHVLVRMPDRYEDQWFRSSRGHPYAVRILRRDVDNVSFTHGFIGAVDAHEAATPDKVDFMFPLVNMEWEARPWLHPYIIRSDASAVVRFSRYAAFTMDAVKRSLLRIEHRQPVPFIEVPQVLVAIPFTRESYMQVHVTPFQFRTGTTVPQLTAACKNMKSPTTS